MADKVKTFQEELQALSDSDLEEMAEGSPMNVHIKAELKRRKKKKEEEKKGGLDYKNSPKEK